MPEYFDDKIAEGTITKEQWKKTLKWWKKISKDLHIGVFSLPYKKFDMISWINKIEKRKRIKNES